MKYALAMTAGLLALAAAGGLPGCNSVSRMQAGPAFLRYEGVEDAQVRSVVFHQMMQTQSKEQVVFVSFGQSGTGWVDPPKEFFSYLADTGLKLAPVSKARIPQIGQAAKSGGPALIVDSSGKPGKLYSVRITHWLDDNAAAVEGARLEGAVPAGGIRCTVRRVSGAHWRIDEAEFW